jgi:hypothetical protein
MTPKRPCCGTLPCSYTVASQAIAGKLQELELAAERVELEFLESWAAARCAFGGAPEPEAVAASNLVAYLAAAEVRTSAAAAAIRAVLAAAFPVAKQA